MQAPDLMKALIKPRIRVGNEYVQQGRNQEQVSPVPSPFQDHSIPVSVIHRKTNVTLPFLFPSLCFRFDFPSVLCQRPCTRGCSSGLSPESTKPSTQKLEETSSSVFSTSLALRSSRYSEKKHFCVGKNLGWVLLTRLKSKNQNPSNGIVQKVKRQERDGLRSVCDAIAHGIRATYLTSITCPFPISTSIATTLNSNTLLYLK